MCSKRMWLCFFPLVGRHIDSECNIYAKKNLFRISTAELLIVKFPTAVFFPYIIFFAPNKKTKEKEKLNSVLSECRSWTVIAKSIKGIPSWGCVVRFFYQWTISVSVCFFLSLNEMWKFSIMKRRSASIFNIHTNDLTKKCSWKTMKRQK